MNTDRQWLECIRDQVIAARVALIAAGEFVDPGSLDTMGYYRLPALLQETEQELCIDRLTVEEEVLKAA